MPAAKLTDLWAELTPAPIGTLRVQRLDLTEWSKDWGPAVDYLWGGQAGCFDQLRVGPVMTGEHRCAYRWWTVFLDGEAVGELQDLGFTLSLEVEIAAVHFPW